MGALGDPNGLLAMSACPRTLADTQTATSRWFGMSDLDLPVGDALSHIDLCFDMFGDIYVQVCNQDEILCQ
jgi:hypothetical protein